MAVEKVDGAGDDDGELTVERCPGDRPSPVDRPGAEGFPSRADSRRGALAAGEGVGSAVAVSWSPGEEVGGGERSAALDGAVGGVIDREGAESGEAGCGGGFGSYAECLDVAIVDGGPTPREVLERFDPVGAGLPEVTEEDAAEYVSRNVGRRPWLASAMDCDPAVQRVLVALDQGQGHALERHEGYADDEKLQRRVTALEDPAQVDDGKRAEGIDGCKPGDKPHKCGDTATAVHDPSAFATMFARGVEHPKVREALQALYDADRRPRPVSIPVVDLLGADGHSYCSGYRIEPVGGSIDAARDCRSAWVEARRMPDREADVPEPRCAPVDSFETADAQYFFRSNRDRDGYEIATMYVEP